MSSTVRVTDLQLVKEGVRHARNSQDVGRAVHLYNIPDPDAVEHLLLLLQDRLVEAEQPREGSHLLPRYPRLHDLVEERVEVHVVALDVVQRGQLALLLVRQVEEEMTGVVVEGDGEGVITEEVLRAPLPALEKMLVTPHSYLKMKM